ncbi:hypothetical protein K6L59_03020, partial [Candidatus Phytoplasma sp. Tabriz.2]|nr:hypothetical protein [Candidatus Phytoplasma australiense]
DPVFAAQRNGRGVCNLCEKYPPLYNSHVQIVLFLTLKNIYIYIYIYIFIVMRKNMCIAKTLMQRRFKDLNAKTLTKKKRFI